MVFEHVCNYRMYIYPFVCGERKLEGLVISRPAVGKHLQQSIGA